MLSWCNVICGIDLDLSNTQEAVSFGKVPGPRALRNRFEATLAHANLTGFPVPASRIEGGYRQANMNSPSAKSMAIGSVSSGSRFSNALAILF